MISSEHDDDPSNELHDGEAKGEATDDDVDHSDEGTMNLDTLVSEAETYLKEQDHEVVPSGCQVQYSRHKKPKKVDVNAVDAQGIFLAHVNNTK